MDEASASAEFEVNLVDYAGTKVRVSGRNCECDISVGDVFSWIYRVTSARVGDESYHSYSSERGVTLRVEAIEAYRRDTDTLSAGVGGRLILTGKGTDELRPASDSKLLSYDLLRVDKYVMPRRPIGLAEGEFVVPDDFDDPLPDEIQRYFEGYEEPCVDTK